MRKLRVQNFMRKKVVFEANLAQKVSKIEHKKAIFEANLAQKVSKIEQKYQFLKLI